jgi:hypothetical protein
VSGLPEEEYVLCIGDFLRFKVLTQAHMMKNVGSISLSLGTCSSTSAKVSSEHYLPTFLSYQEFLSPNI